MNMIGIEFKFSTNTARRLCNSANQISDTMLERACASDGLRLNKAAILRRSEELVAFDTCLESYLKT